VRTPGSLKELISIAEAVRVKVDDVRVGS